MKGESLYTVLSKALSSEESAIKYFEKMRWSNGVVSPFDPTSKVYKCINGKYKCKSTGRYFDVKTGTPLANTKLPMTKWLLAMFLFQADKGGVSSCQLARILEITQKTAWYMLMKIREFAKKANANNSKLSGEVEIDETFVGGRNGNRHKDKKVPRCQGRSYKDKVPVFGAMGSAAGIGRYGAADCGGTAAHPRAGAARRSDPFRRGHPARVHGRAECFFRHHQRRG